MSLKTYFDFAEDDYLFLQNAYKRGDVANAMGAIAQNICERYMKHLVDKFDLPDTKEEEEQKKDLLSTHNLPRLFNYIEGKLKEGFSHDTKRKMRVINGFYFSARYPGDGSSELSRDDIEDCMEAVKACRKETLELMAKLEKKPSLSETLDAAEQRASMVQSYTKNKETER